MLAGDRGEGKEMASLYMSACVCAPMSTQCAGGEARQSQAAGAGALSMTKSSA